MPPLALMLSIGDQIVGANYRSRFLDIAAYIRCMRLHIKNSCKQYHFSILEKFNVTVSAARSQCSMQKFGNPSVTSSSEYTVAVRPSMT